MCASGDCDMKTTRTCIAGDENDYCDFMCKDGFYCKSNVCTSVTVLNEHDDCSAQGTVCGAGMECSSNTLKCIKPHSVADTKACIDDDECAYISQCLSGKCTQIFLVGEAGDSCYSSGSYLPGFCKSGLTCSWFTHKCVKASAKNVGKNCETQTDPQSFCGDGGVCACNYNIGQGVCWKNYVSSQASAEEYWKSYTQMTNCLVSATMAADYAAMRDCMDAYYVVDAKYFPWDHKCFNKTNGASRASVFLAFILMIVALF
jgi:hypothetical protein